MKKAVLFIVAYFSFLISYSQDFVFEKITTQKGLSQNDVNCVFQDRSGFLWIGTNDGLNRFDGYNFRTFRVNEEEAGSAGLSSNLIFSVKQDIHGDLWIATSNEGVCKFEVEKETFTQYRNTISNPNFISDNRILALECMKDGSVWVATYFGVDIITEEDGRITVTSLDSYVSKPLDAQGYDEIFEDKLGRIWLGHKSGLLLLSKKGAKYDVTSFPRFTGSNVKSIVPFKDGVLIAASAVFYMHEDSPGSNHFVFDRIERILCRDLLVDRNENIYIATNNGLYIYEWTEDAPEKFRLKYHAVQGLTEVNLNRNIVMSLYEDSSGIIWIGTNGGGLNKYNSKRKKFFHFKATGLPGSLSNNKIRFIYEDSSNDVWIGTEGGGMNFLSGRGKRDFNSGFVTYDVGNDANQNNVYSIIELEKKGAASILAGTGYPHKLRKFTEKGNREFYIEESDLQALVLNPVFTALHDSRGNIWLGTYGPVGGLYRCTPTANGYKVVNFKTGEGEGSLSSNIIRNLMQDRSGNLWIATDKGLNILPFNDLNAENPHFKVFLHQEDDEQSLSNNYTLELFQASNGVVWVGTMGGGLNKVIADKDLKKVRFECINTRNGLPNNVVKGILEDQNGKLWVASNKGLSRLDPVSMEIMNYDINDGLQDYEFSELARCKLTDGMMLFGGVNGFNAFYPEQIVGDTTKPLVAFTDLQVLNQSVEVGKSMHNRIILDKVINQKKQIRLRYSENSFAIYFAALHYSAPSKNKYKYMLEGFDREWIPKNSNERFAKYTSLRPGKYTFKLFASNNDGVWSDEPKTLEIIVVPPWWQSDLAIVLYIVLAILLLWFFQRYSIIRIKQKNELLMEHFEREKIEELAQMKLRFFTNISHEFRTPLTLIIGSVQKLLKTDDELHEEVKDRYKVIQRNSSIMLRLINQLMDFRKMEQDKIKLAVSSEDLIPFVEDIYTSFTELASSKSIAFNFSSQVENLVVWIDTDKVEKILYNLLSNAFKFTPNGGQIDLSVRVEGEEFVVAVKDNGIGIRKDVQSHIFERFYQATKLKQPNFKGTGIGLSYSKGLAQMHYGDIRFTSEEGQGSCFELVLKMGEEHLKPADFVEERQLSEFSTGKVHQTIPELVVPVTVESSDDQSDFGKMQTILIVEDNMDLLAFLKDNFKSRYRVYTAVNGQEGIDVASENEIDLIVSDVNMPVMSGLELCEEIKSNEKTSHIPVVLLTAKSSAEDTIAGYNLGADAYVVKPFNIDILNAQVRSILSMRAELKMNFRKAIEVVPSEVTTTHADEKFLARLLVIIEENLINSEFTVEQLASEYGLSQIIINKKLKSLTGQTANTFIRSVRLKRACQLLKTGRYSVADVTYEVGFSDLKYFRSCFKKEYDMTPSEYVKSNRVE